MTADTTNKDWDVEAWEAVDRWAEAVKASGKSSDELHAELIVSMEIEDLEARISDEQELLADMEREAGELLGPLNKRRTILDDAKAALAAFPMGLDTTDTRAAEQTVEGATGDYIAAGVRALLAKKAVDAHRKLADARIAGYQARLAELKGEA